ncbi:MAG: FAD-dependent oxidoreductase [Firmicutes bacterium]|nr:FAD-dependent oxidoreductase [Bacillota bacterium]
MRGDVVVVGGGPAGISAAIAAGRLGCKTILLERYGFLGGMSTIAGVYPWMTFHTEGGRQVIFGLAQEIVDRLVKLGASPGHLRDTIGFVHTVTPFDGEAFKLLALDMLREANVKVLLHSYVDEVKTEENTIQSVLVATKSGRIEIRGGMFVDATGDADLALMAGAPVLKGRDSDQQTQPMTLKFRMRGVDTAVIKEKMMQEPENFYGKTLVDKLAELPLTGIQGFYREWQQAGLPINRDQVLLFVGPEPDEVVVNCTRIQGLDGTDVEDLTRAEEEGLRQVMMMARFLRESIPGFEQAVISSVAPQIGIRETRRIEGLYTLTADDVIEGRKFADAIAKSGYPIDIHDPTGKGVTAAWIKGDGAYDIPYRSLVPKGIANLLVGGRCISTSHEAQATTRLTPSCMATGQAAGTAAALALQTQKHPAEVDINLLQQELRRQNAYI